MFNQVSEYRLFSDGIAHCPLLHPSLGLAITLFLIYSPPRFESQGCRGNTSIPLGSRFLIEELFLVTKLSNIMRRTHKGDQMLFLLKSDVADQLRSSAIELGCCKWIKCCLFTLTLQALYFPDSFHVLIYR